MTRITPRSVMDDQTEESVSYDYDDYGRLVKTTYPGHVEGTTDNYVSFTYDGFGRRIQANDFRTVDTDDRIDGDHTISYDYDPLGQLIRLTNQDDYVIDYSYRADSQKKTVTVDNPSQETIYSVEYIYDESGRLISVEDSIGASNVNISAFTYDDNGNRETLTHHLTAGTKSATITYGYNLDNFLTNYATSYSGYSPGTAFSFSTANGVIDGLGRLVSGTETISDTSATPVNITYTHNYSYDRLGQLTNASIVDDRATHITNWSIEYDYYENDDLHHIQDDGEAGWDSTRSYDGNLLMVSTGSDSFSLTWFDNGNLTSGITRTSTLSSISHPFISVIWR